MELISEYCQKLTDSVVLWFPRFVKQRQKINCFCWLFLFCLRFPRKQLTSMFALKFVTWDMRQLRMRARKALISFFSSLPHTSSTPKGIEDVSAYPYLFAELMGQGWAFEDLAKLAGGNLLRVFSEVNVSPSALRAGIALRSHLFLHFTVPCHPICEIVNHPLIYMTFIPHTSFHPSIVMQMRDNWGGWWRESRCYQFG